MRAPPAAAMWPAELLSEHQERGRVNYHAYFRRPDDCVVYTPVTEDREISLVHRGGDGRWHCALCDATDCRHARVAVQADDGAADPLSGAGSGIFTVPLPNG